MTSVKPWSLASHHDSSNVLGIVSVQVELECHHLVIVRLQLTLHHPVHFIRELQRQTGSTVLTGFCLLSKAASKAAHKRHNMFLCVSKHEDTSLVPLLATWCVLHVCVICACCTIVFRVFTYYLCKINILLKKRAKWQILMTNQSVLQSFCTPVMRSLDRALLLNILPAVRLAAVFSFFSDRPS